MDDFRQQKTSTGLCSILTVFQKYTRNIRSAGCLMNFLSFTTPLKFFNDVISKKQFRKIINHL